MRFSLKEERTGGYRGQREVIAGTAKVSGVITTKCLTNKSLFTDKLDNVMLGVKLFELPSGKEFISLEFPLYHVHHCTNHSHHVLPILSAFSIEGFKDVGADRAYSPELKIRMLRFSRDLDQNLMGYHLVDTDWYASVMGLLQEDSYVE